MARQIQRHPVRGSVVHVDFLVVRPRRGRHRRGARSSWSARPRRSTRTAAWSSSCCSPLTVRPCRATSRELEVDITGSTSATRLRVADLTLPSGVTTDVDPDEPIVVSHRPRHRGEPEPGSPRARRRRGRGRRSAAEGEAAEAGRRRRGRRQPEVARSDCLGARTGTPADLLVVGLGQPGCGVRPHPPQRRRRGRRVLAARHGGHAEGQGAAPSSTEVAHRRPRASPWPSRRRT